HNAAVEPICRKYLNTRSQLMPYLYSAAWETHTTGIPLIRSLGLEFPEDPTAWATADAYLFGPSLLVAPVFEQGATERKVYLPAGGWYDFWTAKRIEGGTAMTVPASLETIPLFVRAGSIVPTGPVKQYVGEPSTEPVRLTIYPGADGRFQLYDDDGLSFAYEKGAFAIVDLEWDDASKMLHYSVARDGLLPAKELTVSLRGGESKRITPRRTAQSMEF
ncbi:MAG TPA: DUF5110 domain-containing protein, partial [Acidobacteriaceae bacterium]